MRFSANFRLSSARSVAGPGRGAVVLALGIALFALLTAGGQSVPKRDKQIIGATATIKEAGTGIPFSARIDTGAATCSLHVEKLEIENPDKRPNKGKPIRFLIKNEKGESAWIDSTVAGVVRVRSSVFKNGEFDRRFKVWLTLDWEGVQKKVRVTLNDRTNMDYPLLIGRNWLRGDFLVDVDIDSRKKKLARD